MAADPPDPSLSPYAVTEVGKDVAFFSVVTVDDGELAGESLLWGIDQHNRLGHAGLALLPAFRGRGWSVEVLQLLCRYGFALRGLHRLQLETLADNTAMRRAATKVGFEADGVLREGAWVLGSFVDVIVLGLLASDWHDESSQ